MAMPKMPVDGEFEAAVIADPDAQLARWSLPVFDHTERAPRTAQDLEDIEAAAYQEGRLRGYEDGFAAGGEDARRQAERLRTLIAQISRPLVQLDDEVERGLVDLACAIARRLLGDELQAQPEHVLALTRSALAALPEDLRTLRLYLHPEDAVLVREQLPPPPVGEYRVIDDAALARGDCRVVTESAFLDARLDARIALVAATLGNSPA